MLGRIQRRLSALYDIETPPLEPFLCDEDEARAAVGEEEVRRGEALLVREDADGISIGLYISAHAIEILENRTRKGRLQAFWLAAEGVSHFVYLAFRAANDETVTQLELELQAEVDKFAAAVLEGRGASPGEASLVGRGVGIVRARSRALRSRQFGDVEFLDDAATAEGERYRLAHRAAARYTAKLESTFLAEGDVSGFVAELRRFYRLGGADKLAHARGRERFR